MNPGYSPQQPAALRYIPNGLNGEGMMTPVDTVPSAWNRGRGRPSDSSQENCRRGGGGHGGDSSRKESKITPNVNNQRVNIPFDPYANSISSNPSRRNLAQESNMLMSSPEPSSSQSMTMGGSHTPQAKPSLADDRQNSTPKRRARCKKNAGAQSALSRAPQSGALPLEPMEPSLGSSMGSHSSMANTASIQHHSPPRRSNREYVNVQFANAGNLKTASMTLTDAAKREGREGVEVSEVFDIHLLILNVIGPGGTGVKPWVRGLVPMGNIINFGMC
jgi:hypothetical protein